MRQNIPSGSYLEPIMGFSRAVRIGNHIAVAGTGPIGTDATDTYGQLVRCFEITRAALAEAGATMQDVTRTRILLTDIADWEEAARAHGEIFRDIRPVITVMQVSAFVDPAWRVETEVDAIVGGDIASD
ncbi:RidA family protein [Jannaschia pohangensis]|uniref:Enamine deaminase RidA, house cleaning of reactive enamine intermediates, YjgF/YER057c/UK114 family n=1 Tax=Jannaschia pohangensis TaxID=390807 RepID=A0A1I3HV47_9RHOB|nr:RidA family protein [Jannaschia pohangensis]SFI39430.1 Enamine deaminase RidA, house cleaning of reactive enamine intermediates, YjgF/YER057c/UK114 family [Jannaschia pohangensis]